MKELVRLIIETEDNVQRRFEEMERSIGNGRNVTIEREWLAGQFDGLVETLKRCGGNTSGVVQILTNI